MTTMMTLLAPLRYWRIRHGSVAAYNFVLPAAGSIAVTALLLAWQSPAVVFGKDGYLAQLTPILAILGGFFVAALTLITGEHSAVLQSPANATSAPILPPESVPLSRKRFLGYLFGYLAFSSFCLAGVVVVANLVAPSAALALSPPYRECLKWAFLMAFNFWLGHVFIATLLGLFYFTERLHVADKRVVVGNPGAKPQPAE